MIFLLLHQLFEEQRCCCCRFEYLAEDYLLHEHVELLLLLLLLLIWNPSSPCRVRLSESWVCHSNQSPGPWELCRDSATQVLVSHRIHNDHLQLLREF
jgi:hypothetical protein